MSENKTDVWEGWAVVELMGHRRFTGYVRQAELAGGSFLRLDIPSEPPCTQFYSPAAVYCITPTTEELARQFAANGGPKPVNRYELPKLTVSESKVCDDDEPCADDQERYPY